MNKSEALTLAGSWASALMTPKILNLGLQTSDLENEFKERRAYAGEEEYVIEARRR